MMQWKRFATSCACAAVLGWVLTGCEDDAPAAPGTQRDASTAAVSNLPIDPEATLNPPYSMASRPAFAQPGEGMGESEAPSSLARIYGATQPPEGPVSWTQAARFMGMHISVEGRVVDTGRTRSDNIHFLNFKENDRDAFYLAVFREAFEGLGGSPADTLLDKTIRVTGPVSTYNGRPQIKVTRANQIEVLEGGMTVKESAGASHPGDADDPSPLLAENLEIVPWNEASRHLGKVIVVEGDVVDTNNLGHICFLNFHKDWQDKFYIVVFEEAFSGLIAKPENHFLNQRIRVRGEVKLHQDRPQIQVRNIRQIVIVEQKEEAASDGE